MITETASTVSRRARGARAAVRVLLLGGEDRSSSLACCLTMSGFAVELVALSGRVALDIDEAVDVLVVDAQSLGDEELALVKAIRAADRTVPIIVVSALDTPSGHAGGLEAGADSYFSKPYSALVLAAQINAHVRRRRAPRGQPPRTSLVPGCPLRIDLRMRSVSNEQAEVQLTPREAALLGVLARRPGAYVSTAQLHLSVWGTGYTVGVVASCIRELRRRLACADAAGLIESRRGFGYRLARRAVLVRTQTNLTPYPRSAAAAAQPRRNA